MEDPSSDFGSAYHLATRPQTVAVQRIIDLNKQFEAATSRALGLNATDTAALGEVMMTGPQSPTELARRLRITTAAITTVVDRLEAAGHVTRQQHPTDRRGVLVSPTEESVNRAMRTLIPIARAVDSAVDEFSEGEREVILHYLQAVAAQQLKSMPE